MRKRKKDRPECDDILPEPLPHETGQLLKYAKDLSELYMQEKERRRSLETSKEKIETIIAGMTDGMLATDSEHRVIEANPVACRLLEIAHDELIGRNFLDIPAVSDLKKRTLLPAETVVGQKYKKVDLEFPDRRLVRIITSRLRTDQGYIYIFRDISSEKRAENAKQTLLAILSHELRTPLASILNFSYLLAEEFSGSGFPKAQQYLEHIERNGTRLARIFEELLQFIQLEKEYPETMDMEVRLDDLLHEVLAALQPEIHDRKILVRTSIEPENPVVPGSRNLLETMFMQVIHNGVVYSHVNGEVEIMLSAEDDHYHVVIRDKGIGIPAVELEKIFSGFYQVQDHMSGDYDGLGLGLTMARRVAEKHQGTLRLESEMGKGTSCFIVLPGLQA